MKKILGHPRPDLSGLAGRYIRAPEAASRQLTSAIETQAREKLKNYPYIAIP